MALKIGHLFAVTLRARFLKEVYCVNLTPSLDLFLSLHFLFIGDLYRNYFLHTLDIPSLSHNMPYISCRKYWYT